MRVSSLVGIGTRLALAPETGNGARMCQRGCAHHPLARPRSDPRDSLQPAALDRVEKGAVVLLVLVRIRLGELGERAVEGVSAAEVGGDRDRVPGARVRACQDATAEPAVELHARRQHGLYLRRGLPVPELADVEVTTLAVDACAPQPAEEDVARRLHEALTLDDALALVAELALVRERLEHRGACLLGLEEQRIGLVPAE